MTTNKTPNLDAPSADPPRRKFFGGDLGTSSDAPSTLASAQGKLSPRVAAKTKQSKQSSTIESPTTVPVAESRGAVGRKRGPKPSAEPLEHWTTKIKSAHLDKLNEMLDTAPRHVKKQDLVDFIFTDFFKRNPVLPEFLQNKRSTSD